MELKFDKRGKLEPYERNKVSLDQINSFFVEQFDEKSTRHKLFSNFEFYIEELKVELGDINWDIWIKGSFATNKLNPRDIDIVNLLDFQVVEENETLLESFFGKRSKEKYQMDAFIVKIYPEQHPYYTRTQSDLVYWDNWFSKTRLNRRKQRFPKGYLEIET